MELKTCAITGQQPKEFKFKYNENDSRCKKLKRCLKEQFIALHDQGVRRFLVDGSLGVDMWSGEILLKLKLEPQYSDIELVVVLPYPGHDERWDARSKSRLAFLIKHSAECVTIGKKAWRESFVQRDRYLVDHADCLLAVYDNKRSTQSGTRVTVNYAEKKKLPITLIHPDTQEVTCSY